MSISQDLTRLDPIIQDVIRKAGNFAETEFRRFSFQQTDYKGDNDPFSYVDVQTEQMLMEGLSKIIPGSGFVNEEAGDHQTDQEVVWIIDPVDGTVNFVYGIPHYCVSVGLMVDGQLQSGHIYAPSKGDMYSAILGKGAWRNGEALKVSQRQPLKKGLLATGFPYDREDGLKPHLGILGEMLQNAQGVRRFGSAALDLAYVASGRYDGYYEFSLHPWDIAAGILLIREAGGRVTDFAGKEDCLWSDQIMASNGAIHAPMLEIIRKHL